MQSRGVVRQGLKTDFECLEMLKTMANNAFNFCTQVSEETSFQQQKDVFI